MNKILQNFEDAATGEYTPSKQESSDMKMILESFYEVAQDDAAKTEPQQLDEIASVTLSGDSADEVAQLVKLMNDAGAPEAAPVGPQPTTMPAPVDVPADGPPDMPPTVTPKMMDDFEVEEEPVAEKDYENEPDERYDDHETMTHDLSGGINRRKPKGSIRVKDPANFGENSLAEELSSMLKKKMSEKKDQDGDGDNDFDDVQIARMKASGMSHDEAVAKVKGKKEGSKKNADTEVEEGRKLKDVDKNWKADDEKNESIQINEVSKRMEKKYGKGVDLTQDKGKYYIVPKNGEKVGPFKSMSDIQNHLKESYITEKPEPSDDVSNWIEDFYKSDAPQFKGKDKDSKKNADTEVDEAGKMKGGGDDPCWKGYKMVGTKKKGGKEVPNCVPREGVEEAVGEDSKVNSVIDDIESNLELGMSRLEKDLSPRARERIQSAQDDYLTALKDLEDFVNNKKGVEEAAPKNNPVAKNAGKFNKAQVQTDKKKAMKKGKDVKHKGKDFAMESAPVFERYVKPIINKTPKQMVEFYDREARTIINRLSRERRSLAEANTDTKMHDVVIGRLRENLGAVSEAPYRRRSRSSFGRGRSSWDPNMYSPRGDLGAADKRDFKRREMEVELGDEEPNNYAVSIGGKPWKVFRSQRQAEKAAATIKSKYGKDTKVFRTSAPPSS